MRQPRPPIARTAGDLKPAEAPVRAGLKEEKDLTILQ
jgi:hypothetical protein